MMMALSRIMVAFSDPRLMRDFSSRTIGRPAFLAVLARVLAIVARVLAFLAGVLAVLAGVLAKVLPCHLLCARKRTKADSVDLLNRHVRATERTEQSITNKVT
jgi:hypothetical protein